MVQLILGYPFFIQLSESPLYSLFIVIIDSKDSPSKQCLILIFILQKVLQGRFKLVIDSSYQEVYYYSNLLQTCLDFQKVIEIVSYLYKVSIQFGFASIKLLRQWDLDLGIQDYSRLEEAGIIDTGACSTTANQLRSCYTYCFRSWFSIVYWLIILC